MKFVRMVFLTAALLLPVMSEARAPETITMDKFLERGLLIHAVIGGHEGTFTFDSGEGVSAITPEFASKIGCNVWGQISGFQMSGQRLDMQRCDHVDVKIGDFHARLNTLGVFDLNKFSPPGTKIDGTLGLDVFDGQVITFSYSKRTITVWNRAATRQIPKDEKPFPVHVIRDVGGMAVDVALPVKTPQGTAWFLMDSGNTSPFILVGKHLATPLGLKTDSKAVQNFAATVGDGSLTNGEARVLDLIVDGNLGMTFLAHYDVSIDLANGTGWLSAVEQPKTVDQTP
ncbi:aspartyl protease family protein [Dyella sp. 20L07]|uniref:aspartyl protease family protein n=1 Tax=Dyella sp. 20L07 TaxID=3384240 RepID=UPI003D2A14F8